QLTNLQTLDLSSNNLSELPEWLGQLTNLQTLDLSNNNLFKLPEWLGQLTNLQTLTLRSTYLSELPEGLGQLTNLQTLTLSSNNLFKLPDGLGQLTNLQTLDLSNNNLFKLPKWLGQLTNLQTLDLRSTYLSELPEGLEQLTNLQTLDLRSNNLSVLTVVVGNLPNLHTLYLGENPISDPPLEMLGDALKPNSQTNLDKIRRYFRQLSEAGKAYLYEAKLLIIGEGGAGKTSLACKLKTPDASLCPDEASTEGIDIVNWQFDLSQNHNVDQYHVNIWDFGGQEVYFATHQFFLTKRSVYVLVADTRRQHTDFYNWLRMQEMFGGDSPVILLKNRNRRHGNRFSIENLPQLRERFSNLKEVVELDLDSVPNDAGWTQLLRELEHRFMSLEHIGVARPRTWVQVREYLGDDKRDTITIQDFLEICTDQGIQREADALQFCDYLHHLGDILHFQDDPLLRELVILKPTWGLDAVYRVLDNEKTVENWGQFSYADLFTLWHEPEYAGHQHQLLRLMQNFQLCYQLAGQQDMFIAPQLLHEDVPEYEWEPIDNLQLRYRYPVFMPRGILSRAIVKLHSRIEDQKQVWRSGVILNDGYARAELLELRGESEIRIRISGRHKRDLLMEIVRALDDLHYGFTKLRYEKLIPCNCKACARLTVPHFFRLDKLRGRLANRKRTIECENPPYDDVNIRELIDDFDSVEYDSRRDRFAGGESSNDLETKIGKHFSSDNLKLLCFQLDIDYDNLPGAAKANKVYELIAYCKRRHLTSKLFSGLQKERPNVLWK
ncbi:MAG: GTPase, partial [Chloroflexi bacterium]